MSARLRPQPAVPSHRPTCKKPALPHGLLSPELALVLPSLWPSERTGDFCGVSKGLHELKLISCSPLCGLLGCGSPRWGTAGRTRRRASGSHLALELGFLGGPGGSQIVDHVLQLLVALHQHADLMAQVQAAGGARGLRVNLARFQGCQGLVRSHAHGQQRGRRGQHALDDRPELVKLGVGKKAGAGH